MPRSDLERLAEAIHALAGQVERDVASLQERRRHIAQLAARTARLAGPGDSALIRVVQLARLAAERLADAIEHLVATAGSGHEYADGLAGRSGGAGRSASVSDPDSRGQAPMPHTPASGATRPGRRSDSTRAEDIRRAFMADGDDAGDAASYAIALVHEPPPEPRLEGVDNPASAVVVTAAVAWESIVRFVKWRRRRRRG